jgi:hypothetical protein
MTALTSLVNRVLFIVSFVLAGLAVIEKVVNLAGYTILRGAYDPSRLLELAVIALMFVIALQLREIRHSAETRLKM